MDYAEIYAVDFDGTLNTARTYPELGAPNMDLIKFLKERRAAGDKIILWTCREGELLKAAVKYCNNYGLFFHAVNENLPENIAYFGNNCRKVWAHHYIDDKNMMPEIPGVEASQYHWEEKSKGILGIDMGNGPDMTVIAEPKKIKRNIETERLTYEIIDGGIVTDKENVREFEIENGFTVYAGRAVILLSDYENTGLTPEQIRELAERDTAKAPIDADEEYGFFTCPSCGAAIYASDDFESHKFCLNCGQRIRWEE